MFYKYYELFRIKLKAKKPMLQSIHIYAYMYISKHNYEYFCPCAYIYVHTSMFIYDTNRVCTPKICQNTNSQINTNKCELACVVHKSIWNRVLQSFVHKHSHLHTHTRVTCRLILCPTSAIVIDARCFNRPLIACLRVLYVCEYVCMDVFVAI